LSEVYEAVPWDKDFEGLYENQYLTEYNRRNNVKSEHFNINWDDQQQSIKGVHYEL